MVFRHSVFMCCLFLFLALYNLAQAAKPAPPSGLEVIRGNAEASLNWNPVSGATDYVIYQATNQAGPYTFVGQTQVNSFAKSGLLNDTDYYFVVTAKNADGQSEYSPAVMVSPTLSILKAPHGLQVIPGNGEVTVTWLSVTSATHYSIMRISPDGKKTYFTTTGPSVSFTDRTVLNSSRYHYAVRTMSQNPGAYSPPAAAYPTALFLKSPTSLVADSGSTWTQLTWAATANALHYLLYRSSSPGGPYVCIAFPTSTTYSDTGLTNGTTYYYVVAAVNAVGGGAYSPEASAAVSPLNKPAAPVLSGWPRNKGTTLDWDAAPGAVSYAIFRKSSGDSLYNLIATVTTSNFSDTGLDNGMKYTYIVESRNASGINAPSSEISITPAEALPAPGNIKTFIGNTEATLTWDPVEGAKSYYVQVATTPGGAAVKTASISQYQRSYTATGLTNGQPYYFRVKISSLLPSDYTADIGPVTPSTLLPLAPGSPVADIGRTQASLRWGAAAGGTHYRVYRQLLTGGWVMITPDPLIGTHYLDKNLSTGFSAKYNVVAENEQGSGAWAPAMAVATTSASQPDSPIDVTTIPGNTQASVTWKPIPGITGYYVQMAETPGGVSKRNASITDGKTSYTATGLTNGQDYYFRVRAINGGSYSADIVATPTASMSLAPKILSSQEGNSEVSITWSAVDGATGYNIYRRNSSSPLKSQKIGFVKGTLFTDTGLDNATNYYYSVSGVNGVGEGARAESEKLATPVTTAMMAPSHLVGIAGNTEGTVIWDPVIGASNYSVNCSTKPGGISFKTVSSTKGKPAATITGLTNNQGYYCRVRTTYPAGSAESGEAVIMPSVALPQAPANLTCRASGNTQATLTWNGVDGSTGFTVYRRVVGESWSESPVGRPSGAVFTDTGLANGIDYYYVVSARNSSGQGAWSESEVKCTPDDQMPLAPTGVSVLAGDRQVTLSWSAVGGATRYRVYMASSPDGPFSSSYTNTNTTSFTATGLNIGQPYYFIVQTNQNYIYSAYSNMVSGTPYDGLDMDADSILDSWETAYFGNLITCTSSSDYDNDGYSDLSEFRNQQDNITDPDDNLFDAKIVNSPYGVGYRQKGLEVPFINILLLVE